MERVVARKLARDINCTEILPANQGGAAAFTLIMMCRRAYGGKNKGCLWQSIRGCMQHSPFQAADGPARVVCMVSGES